jgi:hypothetical protein
MLKWLYQWKKWLFFRIFLVWFMWSSVQ